jgi:tetratricopeptide (TPR) repeat protein
VLGAHSEPSSPIPSSPSTAKATDDPFITDCDAYAAGDSDPDRKDDGVPFDKIDPAKAIPACLDVLTDYPNSLRFQYQLGRAYERNGEIDKAKDLYQKAADNGYKEAQKSLQKLASKPR